VGVASWQANREVTGQSQISDLQRLNYGLCGIGANRAKPVRFFYDNTIIGIQLLDYAHRFGSDRTIEIKNV
jgi:hypothetical protein